MFFRAANGSVEELDTWLWHQEEPVGGSSVYVSTVLLGLAREQGIKVLLDGQGADEQLAGYRKFILAYLRQLVRRAVMSGLLREALSICSSLEILRPADSLTGAAISLFDCLRVFSFGLATPSPAARRPGPGQSLAAGSRLT